MECKGILVSSELASSCSIVRID